MFFSCRILQLSGVLMLQYTHWVLEIVRLKLIKICVLNVSIIGFDCFYLKQLIPLYVYVPCYNVSYQPSCFFFVVFPNPVLLVLEHINSLSYFFVNTSCVKIGCSNHREAY